MDGKQQKTDAAPFAEQDEEIRRLNKMVDVLMDRAESSSQPGRSDFEIFRKTIMLEDQVRQRTHELQNVLADKERLLQALWESEARFRGIVHQPLVGISIFEDDQYTFVNPKLAEIFGYELNEMIGMTPLDLCDSQDCSLVEEQVRRRLSGEVERIDYLFRGRRKNGALIHVECHSSVMALGSKTVLIALMLDISERVRAEQAIRDLQEQLRQQAIHDPLTGFYNRLPLNEFFDRELLLALREGRPLSVVMADLDSFKQVNDTYGHLVGDQVLRSFALAARAILRESDLLCRYGGEEFLILLPGLAPEHAGQLVERLRASFAATPTILGQQSLYVTSSFGIASFPLHGAARERLIGAADRALYQAKSAGRNCVRCATLD